jgi:aspartate racemase
LNDLPPACIHGLLSIPKGSFVPKHLRQENVDKVREKYRLGIEESMDLQASTSRLSKKLNRFRDSRLSVVSQPILIEPLPPLDSQHKHVRPLHELFEEIALANPHKVALSFRGADLTYGELNRRANQLARRLRDQGVREESHVALAMGRSFELIIGLLAIVKAGGVYVPLDMTYPRERLSFMLQDTRPDVVLTETGETDLDASLARIVQVTEDMAEFSSESDENLGVDVGPRNAAYVMYTSGSTGVPKGVVIEQRSIIRLVCDPDYIKISPQDTFLQLAPTSFDASTLEIWGPLLNGARMVIMPPGTLTLKDIGRTIEQERVTTLWLTAGLFHSMVDEELPSLATVRNMLAGGDVLSQIHVQKFLEAHRSSTVINGYGPTEGTTFTCCHSLRYGDSIGKTVPIGHPISKTRVLILDESMNPVPPGDTGELYIGGEGVARGYLNQPELTAERFVNNIDSADPAGVMYRSGDLVKMRPDGVIEFLGRKDNQVKIRGFRVELGEVEAGLLRHPTVLQATAIVVENDVAGKTIHAFWTAKAGIVTENSELLRFVGEHLPSYMLPASLTRLHTLPLTENGKVDRKQLLEIAQRNIARQTTYVPPSDVLEVELITIWEKILGVPRIGVRDDFFELGGHSLLAARMFARIEEKLGKRMPLATMFQAPTIEKLAQIMRAEGFSAHWSVVVPIQEHGSKPPLFLVHGLLCNVLSFYRLRQYIAADQPLYGIQAYGMDSGRASFASIPDMAAFYIKEMRAVQPRGPYFLGGFSAGGLVTHEMARQLNEMGEHVQFLALFDSYVEAVGGYWFKSFYSKRARKMVVLALYSSIQTVKRRGVILVFKGKVRSMGVNLRIMLWLLMGKMLGKKSGEPAPQSLTPREAFTRAIRIHKPQPYSGSAVSFRSPTLDLLDPTEGWERYITGKVQHQEIYGGHDDIFSEPHIAGLARQLMQALEASYRELEQHGEK